MFMGVMGVNGCMGYGCLRESMGVYGFSDGNRRQRVLLRTATAKESLPSI